MTRKKTRKGDVRVVPEQIAVLCGHTGPVTCVAVCRPFSMFVSGGVDGRVCVWGLRHHRCVVARSGRVGGC